MPTRDPIYAPPPAGAAEDYLGNLASNSDGEAGAVCPECGQPRARGREAAPDSGRTPPSITEGGGTVKCSYRFLDEIMYFVMLKHSAMNRGIKLSHTRFVMIRLTFPEITVELQIVDTIRPADVTLSSLVDPEPVVRTSLWYHADEGRELPPIQGRYRVSFAGTCCDILDFGCLPAQGRIEEVAEALATFYACLRWPTSSWHIEAVLLMPEDRKNTKNGESYRGLESPTTRSFMLFPASFAPGRYRNTLSCSELIGSVFHEATHVCLEPSLERLWNHYRLALGWRSAEPGVLIRLPGGFLANSACVRTEDLPTQYAAFGADDDRAESVVARALDPSKLHPPRHELVDEFIQFHRQIEYRFERVSDPLVVTRTVRVGPPLPAVFNPRGAKGLDTQPRIIDLDEFVASQRFTDEM